MVDKDIIQRKILFMETALKKLEKTAALSYEEFKANFHFVDSAKYNLQVVIEAMIDAASHIVARERWGVPVTSGDYIKLLVEHGVFEKEQGLRFIQMIKFRNRIVHLYQDIDEGQIYKILQEDLEDVRIFMKGITKTFLR
jgi:uncharacterized protein YutE (UPF0331/DUF86 family)